MPLGSLYQFFTILDVTILGVTIFDITLLGVSVFIAILLGLTISGVTILGVNTFSSYFIIINKNNMLCL